MNDFEFEDNQNKKEIFVNAKNLTF